MGRKKKISDVKKELENPPQAEPVKEAEHQEPEIPADITPPDTPESLEMPSGINPVTGEKIRKEGTGKYKRRKKAVSITPETIAIISPAVCLPFDYAFDRLNLPKLTPKEKEELAKAVAAVINKYSPTVLSTYGEELALIMLSAGIIIPRYMQYKKNMPKAPPELQSVEATASAICAAKPADALGDNKQPSLSERYGGLNNGVPIVDGKPVDVNKH